MSRQEKHHWIVEHLWRGIRSGFILIGMIIWLFMDGWQTLDWVVIGCGAGAAICDQLHGFICKRIQRFMKWTEDFSDYE